jgi:hypothetical protein
MAATMSLTIEQHDLQRLAARFKAVEGGNKLRLTLIRNLRKAVAPAVSEAKAGATALHGSTRPWGGDMTPLGAAIAAGIGTQVRLTGIRAGIKVRAVKKGMPRGFRNAPQRFNRADFQHPVFGRRDGTWVVQIGKPDFFDRPLKRDKAKYRAACIAAMNEMAALLAAA